MLPHPPKRPPLSFLEGFLHHGTSPPPLSPPTQTTPEGGGGVENDKTAYLDVLQDKIGILPREGENIGLFITLVP